MNALHRYFQPSKGAWQVIRVGHNASISWENNWNRISLTTEEIVDKTDHRPEWFLVQCSTQHLGPLPFFLVSKYGEWAVVTFFWLPTTLEEVAYFIMKLCELCFHLQSFILRHGPSLVHCEPPLFSNLNWGISQWAQKYRISQWAQQYRISQSAQRYTVVRIYCFTLNIT